MHNLKNFDRPLTQSERILILHSASLSSPVMFITFLGKCNWEWLEAQDALNTLWIRRRLNILWKNMYAKNDLNTKKEQTSKAIFYSCGTRVSEELAFPGLDHVWASSKDFVQCYVAKNSSKAEVPNSNW